MMIFIRVRELQKQWWGKGGAVCIRMRPALALIPVVNRPSEVPSSHELAGYSVQQVPAAKDVVASYYVVACVDAMIVDALIALGCVPESLVPAATLTRYSHPSTLLG